jgi:hypothetical protein
MSYGFMVWAVDTNRLKQAAGSKDETLLRTIAERFASDLAQLDDIFEDSELSVYEALRQIIDGTIPLGAALAYYSVFSMGPLLLIVVSIAGIFFGGDAVREALTGQFRSLLGPTGSQAVEAMLKGASSPSSGILSTVISRMLRGTRRPTSSRRGPFLLTPIQKIIE